MTMIKAPLSTGNCKLMFVIKHIYSSVYINENPSPLSSLLYLLPDEGYYQSGRFQFEIDVPEAYNMVVSQLSLIVWSKKSMCVSACVSVYVCACLPVYLSCQHY